MNFVVALLLIHVTEEQAFWYVSLPIRYVAVCCNGGIGYETSILRHMTRRYSIVQPKCKGVTQITGLTVQPIQAHTSRILANSSDWSFVVEIFSFG